MGRNLHHTGRDFSCPRFFSKLGNWGLPEVRTATPTWYMLHQDPERWLRAMPPRLASYFRGDNPALRQINLEGHPPPGRHLDLCSDAPVLVIGLLVNTTSHVFFSMQLLWRQPSMTSCGTVEAPPDLSQQAGGGAQPCDVAINFHGSPHRQMKVSFVWLSLLRGIAKEAFTQPAGAGCVLVARGYADLC